MAGERRRGMGHRLSWRHGEALPGVRFPDYRPTPDRERHGGRAAAIAPQDRSARDNDDGPQGRALASLRDLAKRVEVIPTLLSKVETEDWKPKEDKLRKIALYSMKLWSAADKSSVRLSQQLCATVRTATVISASF